VSKELLDSQLKCLRLFRCFCEADNEILCSSLMNDKIFDNKVINLSYTSLLPYDVECIILFLKFSPYKEWKRLNLFNCHIQDHGLRVLRHGLIGSNVTIEVVNLQFNNLTLLLYQ